MPSANDLLDLEFEADQTSFAANETSKTAFSAFFDGSRWMIYRNIVTNALHWDFVSVLKPNHTSFDLSASLYWADSSLFL